MSDEPKKRGRPTGDKWRSIERDFRETTLPLLTIAEKHGLMPARIRARAKEHGWTRPEGAPTDTPGKFVYKPAGGFGVGGAAMGLGTGGPARGPKESADPFAGDPRRQGYHGPTAKSIAAREQAEQMLAMLAEMAADPAVQANARVAAATAVLNRRLGMPTATVNINTDDPNSMTDEELASIAAGSG